MARSKKPEPPAASQDDAPAARASPPDPPPAKHGPAGPPRTLYGFASLRAVMKLSTDVPIEQVCQEAALELLSLRAVLSGKVRTVNSYD
jgi:hypothetical protein